MKMLTVVAGLERMREAREAWGKGRTEFFSAYDLLLRRYIYEGCANYMGATQIAKALGVSPRTIREKMRALGLDPKAGKRALNSKASEAMLENAALMGIEPSEMDLTSPLAYLPMGSQLRQQLQDQALADSRAIEEPEVSRNAPLTDEEWDAIVDCSGEEGYDTEKAEALWPGFTKPGGEVLRLAIDALLRSRA
jgi:hypothetical protein